MSPTLAYKTRRRLAGSVSRSSQLVSRPTRLPHAGRLWQGLCLPPQPHQQTPSSQLKCTRQFSRHSIVMALMGWFVLVSYFFCFLYMRVEAWHVYPLKHRVRDVSPGAC